MTFKLISVRIGIRSHFFLEVFLSTKSQAFDHESQPTFSFGLVVKSVKAYAGFHLLTSFVLLHKFLQMRKKIHYSSYVEPVGGFWFFYLNSIPLHRKTIAAGIKPSLFF